MKTPARILCSIMLSVQLIAAPISATLAAQEKSWDVNSTDVAIVEKLIEMPEGSGSVDDYDRYYAGGFDGDKRLIFAVFYGYASSSGKVFILKSRADLPNSYDSGCGHIVVVWDYLEKEAIQVTCYAGA